MKVTVKVKFNATKERLEQFGLNKYLLYLSHKEDNESNIIIASFLSKNLGVPPSKIKFSGFDPHKDRVFEVL